jgi:hypothetical protein
VKKSRFTEERITFALKQVEIGDAGGGGAPANGDFLADVLPTHFAGNARTSGGHLRTRRRSGVIDGGTLRRHRLSFRRRDRREILSGNRGQRDSDHRQYEFGIAIHKTFQVITSAA